jgi:hypothetical protein
MGSRRISLSLPGHLRGVGPADGTCPVGLRGTALSQVSFSSSPIPLVSVQLPSEDVKETPYLPTPSPHHGWDTGEPTRLPTFNHLSTHLVWNSWLQGRTRSSCRASKSLKQTTHLERGTECHPCADR